MLIYIKMEKTRFLLDLSVKDRETLLRAAGVKGNFKNFAEFILSKVAENEKILQSYTEMYQTKLKQS